MIPPGFWGYTPAMAAMVNTDPEEGAIYPTHANGNGTQAQNSAYFNQGYRAGDSDWREQRPLMNREELDELACHERLLSQLVHYMMVKMEPTDRCLRPYGDIYDPARLEKEDNNGQ